jgi:hypothetical protein
MSLSIISVSRYKGILTAFEPEQADDTTDTNVLLEDIRDTHAGIE